MGILLGPELLNDYAHRCGITSDIPPFPSSYLGACDISLNELTGVYATFADAGVWQQQHIITQVKDERGDVIFQYQSQSHRVFTPQVARQVTGMMQNVLDFGTGAPVRQQFGFTAPAAGKTGTTNDYKDALFEGFTAHLVAGVWIGYDTPREIMPGGYGAAVALPVWANVMKQMRGLYPMEDFPVPPGLEAVDVGGGLFDRGERYFLTPAQRNLIDHEPESPEAEEQDQNQPTHRNIFDSFFNLFR
jgi:penicillin-binding protein 1A